MGINKTQSNFDQSEDDEKADLPATKSFPWDIASECAALIFLTLEIQEFNSPLVSDLQIGQRFPLVFWSCVSAMITGALLLCKAKLSKKEGNTRGRLTGALAVLSTFAGILILIGSVYGSPNINIELFFPISGIFLGIGIAALWIESAPTIAGQSSFNRLIICAFGIVIGWCVYALVNYFPALVEVICLIFSASYCAYVLYKNVSPYSLERVPGNIHLNNKTESIVSAFKITWIPLLSVLLLEFIVGLVWDPELSQIGGIGESIFLASFGTFIAAAFFVGETYTYVRHINGKSKESKISVDLILENKTENALRNVVVSLCLVAFMLQPFFTERLAGLSLITAIIRDFCFFNLYGFAIFVCFAPHRSRISACLLVIAFALGKLIGINAIHILGVSGRPVSVIILAVLTTVIFCWTLAQMFKAFNESQVQNRLQKEEKAKEISSLKKGALDQYKELAKAHNLSDRETEVFLQLVQGYSQKHIADSLFISINTVKTHVRNIYRKFDVDSKDELLTKVSKHT